MVNSFLPSSVNERAKVLLATLVMRLPRFCRSTPCYPGARIAVYHEVPSVAAKQFRRHLAYFFQTYEVVSLDQLAEALRHGHSVDGWLAITFDEGFKDNAEIAAPLLREFGLTACFFVTTDFVSLDPGDRAAYLRFARVHFRRPDVLPAMTWDDLHTLHNQGFAIGSHTRSHRNLAVLPRQEAVVEIFGSLRDIEKHICESPVHFAWPFGGVQHFSESLRQYVREAGYATCCSAVRGINTKHTSPYALWRDHVEPDWPLVLVRFFLEGGYDWVRHLGLLQHEYA